MAMDKVSVCVLVAICFFAVTNAFNTDRVQTMTNDDESTDIDVDMAQLDEAMETLEKLQQLFNAMAERKSGGSCNCRGLTCRCCVQVRLEGLCANLCLVLSFNPRAGSASVSVIARGKYVFKKAFSLRRIPALCFNYKIGQFCIEFYQISLPPKTAKGCVRVNVNNCGQQTSVNVGCFNVHCLDSAKVPFPFSGIRMEDAANEIEIADGNLYVEKELFAEKGQTIDEYNNEN